MTINRNSNQYLKTSWSTKTGIIYIANPNNALWFSGKSLKITINLHQTWFPQNGSHFHDPCKNESTKQSHSLKPWPPKRANFLSCIWLTSFEPEQLGGGNILTRCNKMWDPGEEKDPSEQKGLEPCFWNLHLNTPLPCRFGRYVIGHAVLAKKWKKIYLAGPPLHFQRNCGILHPKSFPELRSLTGSSSKKKWLDWCIYRKSITGRLPWLTIFASKGWDTWL